MKSGLSAQQLEAFERDGFLVVEGVLSSEDLSGIEIEYAEIIERTASALVEPASWCHSRKQRSAKSSSRPGDLLKPGAAHLEQTPQTPSLRLMCDET